jgi:hypothetical protein
LPNSLVTAKLLEEKVFIIKAAVAIIVVVAVIVDRLCGLVVTVSGYRSSGPGFDSWRY